MNSQQVQSDEVGPLAEGPKLKLIGGPKLVERRRHSDTDNGTTSWVDWDVTCVAHGYLFDTVVLGVDLTLGDLFGLLDAAPVLPAVMRRNFSEQLMVEARKGLSPDFKPGYAPDGMEYLELRWLWNFDSSTREYRSVEQLTVFAMGYQLREPLDNGLGSFHEIGHRAEWDVSMIPLRTMLSLPLRLSNEVTIREQDIKSDNFNSLLETVFVPTATLGQVLHGVLWELSYFGHFFGQNDLCAAIAAADKEFGTRDRSNL